MGFEKPKGKKGKSFKEQKEKVANVYLVPKVEWKFLRQSMNRFGSFTIFSCDTNGVGYTSNFPMPGGTKVAWGIIVLLENQQSNKTELA